MNHLVLATAQNCNGSEVCKSGSAALGLAALIIVGYLIGRRFGIWK